MKTAVVVLADGFEEIEAVTPIDLLRRAGVNVIVAGLTALKATGSHGLVFGCDAVLEDVAPGWDALILPGGGPGAKNLSESALLKRCVEQTLGSGAWLGAICASPAVVLGSQGFLKGKRFTGYPGTEAQAVGATYVVEPVVVDGRIVTSRGVGTANAFALKLAELLAGPDQASETARAVLLG